VALQNLGVVPVRPADVADVSWVQSAYPSFSSYAALTANYTFSLPSNPTDRYMQFCEVYNAGTVPITITVPDSILITLGLFSSAVLPVGKTAFYGFRYSSHAGSWFLLSSTQQF